MFAGETNGLIVVFMTDRVVRDGGAWVRKFWMKDCRHDLCIAVKLASLLQLNLLGDGQTAHPTFAQVSAKPPNHQTILPTTQHDGGSTTLEH